MSFLLRFLAFATRRALHEPRISSLYATSAADVAHRRIPSPVYTPSIILANKVAIRPVRESGSSYHSSDSRQLTVPRLRRHRDCSWRGLDGEEDAVARGRGRPRGCRRRESSRSRYLLNAVSAASIRFSPFRVDVDSAFGLVAHSVLLAIVDASGETHGRCTRRYEAHADCADRSENLDSSKEALKRLFRAAASNAFYRPWPTFSGAGSLSRLRTPPRRRRPQVRSDMRSKSLKYAVRVDAR